MAYYCPDANTENHYDSAYVGPDELSYGAPRIYEFRGCTNAKDVCKELIRIIRRLKTGEQTIVVAYPLSQDELTRHNVLQRCSEREFNRLVFLDCEVPEPGCCAGTVRWCICRYDPLSKSMVGLSDEYAQFILRQTEGLVSRDLTRSIDYAYHARCERHDSLLFEKSAAASAAYVAGAAGSAKHRHDAPSASTSLRGDRVRAMGYGTATTSLPVDPSKVVDTDEVVVNNPAKSARPSVASVWSNAAAPRSSSATVDLDGLGR